MELLDILPGKFTAAQAIQIIGNTSMNDSVKQFKEILDTNYELESSAHLPINERVIFPMQKLKEWEWKM